MSLIRKQKALSFQKSIYPKMSWVQSGRLDWIALDTIKAQFDWKFKTIFFYLKPYNNILNGLYKY